MNKIICIAGQNISVGQAVYIKGSKKVYAGKLLKPWTWFRFEKLSIVEPAHIDHIAVVKQDIKSNSSTSKD